MLLDEMQTLFPVQVWKSLTSSLIFSHSRTAVRKQGLVLSSCWEPEDANGYDEEVMSCEEKEWRSGDRRKTFDTATRGSSRSGGKGCHPKSRLQKTL